MNDSDRGTRHADDGAGGGGFGSGSNVAKYKLMSPAKLPISRSPCITIPPGLSPTSFLDSPVLLPNNMKAEPSPTTGSLCLPRIMHSSAGLNTFPSGISCSNDLAGNKSNCFEFKPQSGSNSISGLPMAGSSALAEPSEQTMQLASEIQSCKVAPSIATSCEVAGSSRGLGIPPAVHMVTSNGNMPADADSSISSLRGHATDEAQPAQSDHKDLESSVMNERASEDGYNWRKYGQKLVKGSEYPRSYYKCTHPNCEVKKLFERSPDGQITEIIYKGRHDHPKPLPSRRVFAGSMMLIQEERSEKLSSLNCQEDKLSTLTGHVDHGNEPSINHELSPRAANDTSIEGGLSQSNRINDDPADDDDPFSKRRKMEMGVADINSAVRPFREPRVVVQTLSEVDILDDGYRWRKYGQKVVRGNPNPRSYYKCTSAGCPVRKHIERASHDPKAVITTYEGKHNHDVPSAKTSSHDNASAMSTSLTSSAMAREGEAVSLNMGVGINMVSDNIIPNRFAASDVPGQAHNINTSLNFLYVQGTPMGTFPGYVNGGMMMYGTSSRGDNHVEGHSIGNQLLSHTSNPYKQQTMGPVLMRP